MSEMGKAKRLSLRERYAESKEKRKTTKELKMIELEEKFIYSVKLDMAKQDD